MSEGGFDGISEEAALAKMLFHLELFDEPKADGPPVASEDQSSIVPFRPKQS
jgi:hypothetical protein